MLLSMHAHFFIFFFFVASYLYRFFLLLVFMGWWLVLGSYRIKNLKFGFWDFENRSFFGFHNGIGFVFFQFCYLGLKFSYRNKRLKILNLGKKILAN